MADKKDKIKETKDGDQKKVSPKTPKVAAKLKAPAKETKKETKSWTTIYSRDFR